MTTSKRAVLGAGAWRTALAKALAEKGGEVVLWGRDAEAAQRINTDHENARYLPKARLVDEILVDTLPAELHAQFAY